MRRITVLGSALAVVILTVAGYAIGAVAQEGEPPAADSRFVGSWRVTVTEPTGQTFPVLSSYLADGTALHSGRTSQPAAPGSPSAIQFHSTGHGVWEPTDDETSVITFDVLNTDEDGTFLGTLTVSGTQRLGAGGGTFSGEFVITVRDPMGSIVAAFPTTAEGTRIGIEPAVLPGTPEAATSAG